jgi:hypothetical protein
MKTTVWIGHDGSDRCAKAGRTRVRNTTTAETPVETPSTPVAVQKTVEPTTTAQRATGRE